MKTYLVNIVFMFCCLSGYSQTTNFIPSSYCAGGVSVAQKGEWQSFYNPALLATSDRKAISIVYERRFAMKELSVKAASLSMPSKLLDVGLSLSHFGYSDYSEMLMGLSFAHTFDKYLEIGIQFDYYSTRFSRSLGIKGVVVAQVGVVSELTPDLCVGFCVLNPTRQRMKYGEVVKEIPCLFSLGMQYRFSDVFTGDCQLDKEIGQNLISRMGFEYQLVPVFVLRLGVYGEPLIPTLGCGVRFGGFLLNVDFERHRVLGITSVGMLQYNF